MAQQWQVGQHVQHVDSGRNAFVKQEEGEKMLFYFPDRNRMEKRWPHKFKRASSLILDFDHGEWTPGTDKSGGRVWWTEHGKWKSIGSRGNVTVGEG